MPHQPNLRLAVLALSLGAFAIGTSEFVAMGLLPWFSADLGITKPQALHVISAYAMGVVIGAPITSILGAHLPRRRYLAALIGIYAVANLLAAAAPGYHSLLALRFLAGVPHGGFLGVGMLFAADTLPREERAKGVTQVLLGLNFANILGVPLAGIIGAEIGWRWGFALPGFIALASGAFVLRFAPRVGVNRDARPMQELRALRNPSVLLVILVGAIGFGGLFAVYSLLSSAMLATTHAPSWGVPFALCAFGVGSTLGSIAAARLTIRRGVFASATILIIFAAATQVFASVAVGNWLMMVLSAFLLGLGSGTVVPLQTRLMDVAGKAQSMAAALNHAAFNAANAIGPWLAGIALASSGDYRSSGLVGLGLSAVGLIAILATWHHARLTGSLDQKRPARS